MEFKELNNLTLPFTETAKMPLLFVGHGSPMNAIEKNEFVTTWQTTSLALPKPTAILCISAHWETRGTQLTAMEKPRTIHDFGGFPHALNDVQYPAPGSPVLAAAAQSLLLHSTEAKLDEKWGLDHGAWSILKHMYPGADVPVIQMSIDYTRTPAQHYALAKELSALRKRGVLILGSGNMVHNLRIIDWHKPNGGSDWAQIASHKLNNLILQNNHSQLLNYNGMGTEVKMAIPTPEHYLPLIYMLGLKEEKESATLFNDKLVMGSIAMTSVAIGV